MTTNESAAGGMPHMDALGPDDGTDLVLRRALVGAAGVVGLGMTGLFSLLLIDNMNPGKAVAALGAPVDVDVSKLEPGQIIIVEWKKKPVWLLRRPQAMLDTLTVPGLLHRLKDPRSESAQQPAAQYVNGNYRALKADIFVAVALCTHLQCIPDFRPAPGSVTSWWPGGFHCPCHGSLYDLSGRVIEGSPAPLNMPIPPYYWKTDSVVRIGEADSHGAQENWAPEIW